MVTALSRDSPIPLYYQIQQRFIELIHNGRLVPGDKLPPEESAAEQFGVSRYTLRQAFQSLAREGYAEQIRGRGFFVKEPAIPLSMAWLLVGFSDHMRRHGHVVDTTIVSTGVIECPLSTAERLEIEVDAPILFIKRLRHVDGHPLAFDLVSIPTNLAAGIESLDLRQGSLLKELKDRFGLIVVRENRELRITMPAEEVAEAFQISKRTPVFAMEGVGYSVDDDPIYFSHSLVNERRSHFTFDMILDGDLNFSPTSVAETVRVQQTGLHPQPPS